MRAAMLAYYTHAPYRDPDGPEAKWSDFLLWPDDPETADDEDDEEVTGSEWPLKN